MPRGASLVVACAVAALLPSATSLAEVPQPKASPAPANAETAPASAPTAPPAAAPGSTSDNTSKGSQAPLDGRDDIEEIVVTGHYLNQVGTTSAASAGTYTDSVEIAVKDLEKLVTPIKGAFSKKNR